MRKSAAALLAVTEDVLDLSKIEAGRMTVESYSFDLRSVIEDVKNMLAPMAGRKRVNLDIHYPLDSPCFFIGDGGRIRQVIFNLVGNAVKFTSAGRISIAVRCKRQDLPCSEMQVSVTDSGFGISPEQVGSIFERFSPAHISTARKYGGTGMGLAISKKLIELMGGSIHVESEAGKGSKFFFTVPLMVDTNRGSASFHASN
jgi:two-component system sensor histidine kinase/response regulator